MSKFVYIGYTNWRGEYAVREILPLSWRFGNNQWHKEDQWLLHAVDMKKEEIRQFAMRGITFWHEDNGKPIPMDQPPESRTPDEEMRAFLGDFRVSKKPKEEPSAPDESEYINRATRRYWSLKRR